MWGDILENLRPNDIRITPGMARLRHVSPGHIMLGAGAPSNDQILAAVKKFYGQNQGLVDGTTNNAGTVANNHKDYVAQLNSHNWQNKQLDQTQKDQTSTGIFGAPGGQGGGGLFGPTLDNIKSTQLFSTITLGVSAEAIVGIGGMGGLGCAWDIAKREGPKGNGYATLELGLKIAADINLQVAIFNKLPSQLTTDIYGLNVGIYYFGGVSFLIFYTGQNLDLLGYAIAVGVGVGGGAAVFGGKSWAFG
jgi:hypothetical protein